MHIHILGCGTSSGVPNAAFGFGACNPDNPKNYRSRCSIYINNHNDKILIDTSPDLRQQLLRAEITAIDAVLFTHDHADHCHGIDDIRPIVMKQKKPMDCFFTQDCGTALQKKFGYIFANEENKNHELYPPLLNPHIIKEGQRFKIGNTDIIAFRQQHGPSITTGFRIGNFAYSTDVSSLDDTAFAMLQGLDLWIVDALQINPHPCHSHLSNTLSWVEKIKPKKTYLTHMNFHLDYDEALRLCPPDVKPLYDGLVLEL